MRERSLLVVDDDPNVLTFVEVALRDRGYRVTGVSSAEEALGMLSELSPTVCLLDVRLPGMNGLEAFRALRQAGVEVPVILFTSHASMNIAIDAMKEGAYDFLTKPVRAEALCHLLQQIERADESGAQDLGISGALDEDDDGDLIGKSPAMVDVFKTVGRVAPTDATVLITGESGSGKELVARVIHRNSLRGEGPFIAVNCAAIPEHLLESELFGHEKGAFTGSLYRKIGTVERANGGTLFLDEIGDMSLVLQAKILRALQEREIERVGGTERIPVDVRVLAATNRNLDTAVAKGEFREELYYRLAVVTVHLPPLRDRGDDLRRLTNHFVRCYSRKLGGKVRRVSDDAYEVLERYPWPGNVRELRNVLARSLILSNGPTLLVEDLPELRTRTESSAPPDEESLKNLCKQRMSLGELERRYITELLDETEWNFSRAAEILQVHRNTLRRKLDEYGIERPA